MLVESGGLKGGGELVQIETPAGAVIDSVEYNSDATWPTEPNSGAASLSLFDPADDNALSSSWGISLAPGGTPGEANDTVASAPDPTPNVVINEIQYNTASGDSEFIEFFNAETTAIDLEGFEITQGIDMVFPAGTTIPAGGYLVITKDLGDFQSVYPGVAALEWDDGSLSNGGEDIKLDTPAGVEVDVVDYLSLIHI